MTYSLGVDLGTTFVAAAVARSTGVEMFMLGERDVVTPAVVYVREDGTIITGDAAERRAARAPGPGRAAGSSAGWATRRRSC